MTTTPLVPAGTDMKQLQNAEEADRVRSEKKRRQAYEKLVQLQEFEPMYQLAGYYRIIKKLRQEGVRQQSEKQTQNPDANKELSPELCCQYLEEAYTEVKALKMEATQRLNDGMDADTQTIAGRYATGLSAEDREKVLILAEIRRADELRLLMVTETTSPHAVTHSADDRAFARRDANKAPGVEKFSVEHDIEVTDMVMLLTEKSLGDKTWQLASADYVKHRQEAREKALVCHNGLGVAVDSAPRNLQMADWVSGKDGKRRLIRIGPYDRKVESERARNRVTDKKQGHIFSRAEKLLPTRHDPMAAKGDWNGGKGWGQGFMHPPPPHGAPPPFPQPGPPPNAPVQRPAPGM